MDLNWQQTQVRFIRGGGGVWHPAYKSLGREWFRQNLIDYDLWYITQGEAYLRDQAGQVFTLRAGDCVLMRPHSVVEVWRTTDTRFGNRFFHFDLLDTHGHAIAPEHLAEVPLITELGQFPHVDALTRRMTDLITLDPLIPDEPARADAHHAVASMLKALLIEIVLTSRIRHANRLGGIDEDHFKIALNLAARIREHAGHFDLGPSIARSGYSPDHFRRIVKHVVGQTPHQLVIAARIDRARQLLRQTKLNISAIAEQLGYANVQYFSLQFKQVTGLAPSVYRAAPSDSPDAAR